MANCSLQSNMHRSCVFHTSLHLCDVDMRLACRGTRSRLRRIGLAGFSVEAVKSLHQERPNFRHISVHLLHSTE